MCSRVSRTRIKEALSISVHSGDARPRRHSGAEVPSSARPLDSLSDAPGGVPVHLVAEGATEGAPPGPATLADFRGQVGAVLLQAEGAGAPRAWAGLGSAPASAALLHAAVRALPARLPPGDWRLEPHPGLNEADAALAWALGAHGFHRYREAPAGRPRLHVSAEALAAAAPVARACRLARDMVDTPANDMGPAEIEGAARELADTFGAHITVVIGDDLLAAHPAVHTVGRAAAPHRAPRMIEITWEGAAEGPRVVLVGKGVAFDTGGLDLKPSAGMRLMKKDMGGAAHALALAGLVMERRLPVRLTVLVPTVENAVSADAMRPGDVLATRAGKSVEVSNTDAEGRLILADALTRASELEPDLTVDLATLTGAARVALGPQVIPFYTGDDTLAAELSAAATAVHDPLWRMPLWDGYEDALKSEVADLKNDPDAWAQAGSVTAALFLRRFAPKTGAWVHFDVFAWNPRGRPGWPVGAEAQAIRALDRVLVDRYGASGA